MVPHTYYLHRLWLHEYLIQYNRTANIYLRKLKYFMNNANNTTHTFHIGLKLCGSHQIFLACEF